MNLCVKTGARVLIEEYGGACAADLFLVGETVIAHLGSAPGAPLDYSPEAVADATHRVRLGQAGYYHPVRGLVAAPLSHWRGELVLGHGQSIDAQDAAAILHRGPTA